MHHRFSCWDSPDCKHLGVPVYGIDDCRRRTVPHRGFAAVQDDIMLTYDEGLSMLPFKLIYSDAYFLPIGNHVFPAEKYRRICDRLLATGVAEAEDFLEPQPASDQDILLVHKPE